MKRFLAFGCLSLGCLGLLADRASACPVATGVAVVQSLAVPVAASPCAGQQQVVATQTVAPTVAAVPVVTALAVPTLSVVTTPLVVEQIVKVRQHRQFHTPIRSLLSR